MTALARNTDPLSSHMAAEEMQGARANKQLKKWLTLLKEAHDFGFVDRTASELAHIQACEKWREYEHDQKAFVPLVAGETDKGKYQVSRRFPEAAQHGLVKADSIRQCEVTKRMCKAWSLTTIGSAAI